MDQIVDEHGSEHFKFTTRTDIPISRGHQEATEAVDSSD